MSGCVVSPSQVWHTCQRIRYAANLHVGLQVLLAKDVWFGLEDVLLVNFTDGRNAGSGVQLFAPLVSPVRGPVHRLHTTNWRRMSLKLLSTHTHRPDAALHSVNFMHLSAQ